MNGFTYSMGCGASLGRNDPNTLGMFSIEGQKMSLKPKEERPKREYIAPVPEVKVKKQEPKPKEGVPLRRMVSEPPPEAVIITVEIPKKTKKNAHGNHE